MELIRNEPSEAEQSFLGLQGTDFISELGVAEFLESAYELLENLDIAACAEAFKSLLRSFLDKYNLRYALGEPFSLWFLLPGSFSNLYADLKRINHSNGHLESLLRDFEHAFDLYSRSQDPTDLKTCIAKASNYAEGLASATNGTPGTLGALSNQIGDWPHDKVKESLQCLYKFCSDYPGIRHAGSPTGRRRDLEKKDAFLISLLLIVFSGYLTTHLNSDDVLGM